MNSNRESRMGFNNTCVMVGDTVRIRAKGFGHHCYGIVVEFDDAHPRPRGTTVVRITKANKNRGGWVAGRLAVISSFWLEGEPMI